MKYFKLKNQLFSLMAVGFFLLIAFGSDDSDNSTSTSSSSEKVLPSMTDEEYLTYFQAKWDSVTLKKEGFPQYETYLNELTAILQDMTKVLDKDSTYHKDSPSKLNKLRLKLNASKKSKQAMKNWLTYGQPNYGTELESTCETYLKENANDPESIEIENSKVDGQSKNGWIVIMKYRGRNAFGGLVLNITTFDVRFNPTDKYYVHSTW